MCVYIYIIHIHTHTHTRCSLHHGSHESISGAALQPKQPFSRAAVAQTCVVHAASRDRKSKHAMRGAYNYSVFWILKNSDQRTALQAKCTLWGGSNKRKQHHRNSPTIFQTNLIMCILHRNCVILHLKFQALQDANHSISRAHTRFQCISIESRTTIWVRHVPSLFSLTIWIPFPFSAATSKRFVESVSNCN